MHFFFFIFDMCKRSRYLNFLCQVALHKEHNQFHSCLPCAATRTRIRFPIFLETKQSKKAESLYKKCDICLVCPFLQYQFRWLLYEGSPDIFSSCPLRAVVFKDRVVRCSTQREWGLSEREASFLHPGSKSFLWFKICSSSTLLRTFRWTVAITVFVAQCGVLNLNLFGLSLALEWSCCLFLQNHWASVSSPSRVLN